MSQILKKLSKALILFLVSEIVCNGLWLVLREARSQKQIQF